MVTDAYSGTPCATRSVQTQPQDSFRVGWGAAAAVPGRNRDDPSGTGPALEALVGVGFLERITDAPLFF